MTVNKERQSNFELLRIVAMLLILSVHANYMAFDPPTFDNAAVSWLRVTLENMCIIGTSLFSLKSGWFGIKPKLNKFLKLAIQISTYVLIINIVMIALGKKAFSLGFFTDIVVAGRSYWFMISYLLLYVLSPIINTFIEHSSRSRFKWTLVAFYIFQFVYGWWHNAEFHHGHSALSLMGLYMLARYFRLYGCPLFKLRIWQLLALFVALASAAALQESLFYMLGGEDLGTRTLYFYLRTNSPVFVMESVLIFAVFAKIQFTSRTVNYIASSSLAVYLIHVNPDVFDYYTAMFPAIYNAMPNALGLLAMAGVIVLVFAGCIAIDKLRLLIVPTEKLASALDNLVARVTRYRQPDDTP